MPRPRRAFRASYVAAVVILAALALRLVAIRWGLPDARHPVATFHPDELINLNAAYAADIPHGRFDIGFYSYGTLYFYIVSLAISIGRGYGWIRAGAPGLDPLSPNAAPATAALYLTGRVVTALMGTAAVWATWLAGRRAYGARAGVAGAALLAVAPLAVVHSHFLTVDIPAMCFVAAALAVALPLSEAPGYGRAAAAGVLCGLAGATKYTAILAAVAPACALMLAARSRHLRGRATVALVVAALCAAAAFLVACPGPWLNWHAFWDGTYPGSGVRYELFVHARTGHGDLFTATGPGWWYHAVVSLRYGLGLPLAVLGVAGLLVALWRRENADLVLLAFIAVAYLAAGFSAVRFARYMLPLFPALCMLAGRVAAAGRRPSARAVLTAVVAGVALLTAANSGAFLAAMAGRDARDRAADYLAARANPGASVAFATVPWFYSPPLSPRFGLPVAAERARASAETRRYSLRIPATEWSTSVLEPSPDYVVVSREETLNAVDRLAEPRPTAFMDAVRSRFHPVVFDTRAFPFEGPRPGAAYPDDLLYVLPRVTVYERAGPQAAMATPGSAATGPRGTPLQP